MKAKHCPELQREIDRIKAEIDREDELSGISELREIRDLISKGMARGESYEHGFYRGVYFIIQKQVARTKSIEWKYMQLEKNHPEWFR